MLHSAVPGCSLLSSSIPVLVVFALWVLFASSKDISGESMPGCQHQVLAGHKVQPDLSAAHWNILHTMKGCGRLSEFHLCSTDSSAGIQRRPTASSGLSAIQESWKVGMGFLALPLAVVSPPSPLLEPGCFVLLQTVCSLSP